MLAHHLNLELLNKKMLQNMNILLQ